MVAKGHAGIFFASGGARQPRWRERLFRCRFVTLPSKSRPCRLLAGVEVADADEFEALELAGWVTRVPAGSPRPPGWHDGNGGEQQSEGSKAQGFSCNVKLYTRN